MWPWQVAELGGRNKVGGAPETQGWGQVAGNLGHACFVTKKHWTGSYILAIAAEPPITSRLPTVSRPLPVLAPVSSSNNDLHTIMVSWAAVIYKPYIQFCSLIWHTDLYTHLFNIAWYFFLHQLPILLIYFKFEILSKYNMEKKASKSQLSVKGTF